MDYPKLSFTPRKGYWGIREDYTYYARLLKLIILIKEGFYFDLSSIPRILWPVVASHELGTIGPLLHDYMYRHAGRITVWEPNHSIFARRTGVQERIIVISRKQADQIFLEAMEREGIGKVKRYSAYWAVRLFGLLAWRKNPNELNPTMNNKVSGVVQKIREMGNE